MRPFRSFLLLLLVLVSLTGLFFFSRQQTLPSLNEFLPSELTGKFTGIDTIDQQSVNERVRDALPVK